MTKAKGKATQQRLDSFFKVTKAAVKDEDKFDPFAKKKRKAAGKADAKKGTIFFIKSYWIHQNRDNVSHFYISIVIFPAIVQFR